MSPISLRFSQDGFFFDVEPEPVEHLKLAPLNTRRLRHQGWMVIAHLKD